MLLECILPMILIWWLRAGLLITVYLGDFFSLVEIHSSNCSCLVHSICVALAV